MAKVARGSVLITDAHELAGLGAVRSLGRAGFDVTLGIPEGMRGCAAQRSRYAGGTLRYPDPWKRQPEFRTWLGQQSASGRWRFILPIAEAAIAGAAAVRPGGAAAPLLLPNDALLAYTLSKFAATAAALEAGIPCANTLFVSRAMSDREVAQGLAQMRFPVVVRTDNRLLPGGAYRRGGTHAAATIEAAQYALEGPRARGEAVLVQEFVAGFGVGAFYLRSQGRSVLEFSHRRLHEVPYTGGYSSLRVSTHDAQALEFGRRLLAHIGYSGLAMVEFRRDARTGVAQFLEINGRVWGSIALALHAGVDFPAAYADLELGGEPAPAQRPYPKGMKCRHVPGEISHVLSVLKDPRAGAPRKLWKMAEFGLLFLDARIRHDCFWMSDPGPGFAAAGEVAGLVARRSSRAARERAAPAAPEAAAYPVGAQPKPREILFLCYGNICRSPFAELLWNGTLRGADATLPRAHSAGFVEEAGRRAPERIVRLVRESFGIDLSAHRSRVVSDADIAAADAIFVMDGQNHQDVAHRFPLALAKTFFLGASADPVHFSIADPYGMMDPAEVHAVYERIVTSARALAAAISARPAP
jgi:protein-tyrosine-phosphatase